MKTQATRSHVWDEWKTISYGGKLTKQKASTPLPRKKTGRKRSLFKFLAVRGGENVGNVDFFVLLFCIFRIFFEARLFPLPREVDGKAAEELSRPLLLTVWYCRGAPRIGRRGACGGERLPHSPGNLSKAPLPSSSAESPQNSTTNASRPLYHPPSPRPAGALNEPLPPSTLTFHAGEL